jgi:hypothetical protein
MGLWVSVRYWSEYVIDQQDVDVVLALRQLNAADTADALFGATSSIVLD